MSTRPITPTTLDGIKRLAKHLKAQNNLTHTQALEEAARLAGFQNFTHARRQLDRAASPVAAAPPARPITRGPVPLADFYEQARAAWDAAVDAIAGADTSPTIVWRGPATIAAALEPFMGQGSNHAHFPSGGGHDFISVRPSTERGSLEFRIGGRTGYIMKPRSLTLERIADAPGNSFLLLELDDLKPSGVYERDEGDKGPGRHSEELVELSPGNYADRDLWERGFLDYDEDGREIPFPDEARIVVRWLRGKVLLVAKGSLWNGDPGTYDGRHDKMTAAQIRRIIKRSLEATDA